MKDPAAVFQDVDGVILAGGRSSRLGQDKVLLSIGGKPLIAHLVDLLRPLVREIIVAGHHRPEFEPLGLQTLPDLYPDLGPLGGLYTALTSTDAPYVFLLAGDMPQVPTKLIQRIVRDRKKADAIIPRGPRGLEPLCAVYSRSCIGTLQNSLESGNRRIVNALDGLKVLMPGDLTTEGEPDPFFNINYQEDLERIK